MQSIIVFIEQRIAWTAIPIMDFERQRAAFESALAPLIEIGRERIERAAQFLLVRQHGLFPEFSLEALARPGVERLRIHV